jgi:carbon storage regulator
MLILTRKPGESLYIGDNIKVIIVEIKGNQIRVGVDAPTELRIYREEIYLQILEENKKAAEAAAVPDGGLEGLGRAWKGTQPSSLTTKSSVSKLGTSLELKPLKSIPLKTGAPEVVIKKKKQKQSDE